MDDTKLTAAFTALLAGEAPDASDPRFVLAVMARIERRRFRRELIVIIGLAACAVLLLGALAPMLETTWFDSFAPYASNLAILFTLMAISLTLPYFFPTRD